MDDKLNSQYVKLIIAFALFFYVSSLFMTAFSPTNHEKGLQGYEVLFLGWVQAALMLMASFTALTNFNFSGALSSILLALPWLANTFYINTVFCLLIGFGQRLCLISSISGVFCSFIFIINPVASIGADYKTIPVNITLGGYLWFFTAITLLIAYFVKSVPNK